MLDIDLPYNYFLENACDYGLELLSKDDNNQEVSFKAPNGKVGRFVFEGVHLEPAYRLKSFFDAKLKNIGVWEPKKA